MSAERRRGSAARAVSRSADLMHARRIAKIKSRAVALPTRAASDRFRVHFLRSIAEAAMGATVRDRGSCPLPL